jgi:hypothetical protein
VPAEVEDPTWERLEDQLGWYSRKSGESQRLYKWLKLLEIAVAATMPVVAAVHSPVWVTGGLAAVIVVLEGAQQVYQSRSTGSPTVPPPRRSSMSATSTSRRPGRLRAMTGTASWLSGWRA